MGPQQACPGVEVWKQKTFAQTFTPEKIMFVQGEFSPGILSPVEMEMLQRVYSRIVAENEVSSDPLVRKELALYILKIYSRGLGGEERLYAFCRQAARRKFAPATAMCEQKAPQL